MDKQLHEKLQKWHNRIDQLEKAEKICFTLEANEKPMYSSLFLAAEGKNVAEKEAKALSSQDWRDLQSGLVAARVECNKQKRLLELSQAAFQASYLQSKRESGAIVRMPTEVS